MSDEAGKKSLKEFWLTLQHDVRERLQQSWNTPSGGPSSEIWLLGQRYLFNTSQKPTAGPISSSNPFRFLHSQTAIEYTLSEEFTSDFKSRIWMTYRVDFPPIHNTHYTSDVGWGCMLRSAQMMVAHCLICHLMGRKWRLGQRGENDEWWTGYQTVVRWFFDDYDRRENAIPRLFGIQNMAVRGLQYDVEIGQWFGPRTIANVVRDLVNQHRPIGRNDRRLVSYVAPEGILYLDQMCNILGAQVDNIEASWPANLSFFLLLPIRLGIDSVNPIYYEALKHCFKFPQTCGAAGGRPNSAFYFIGIDGDDLIYLDPHVPRDAVHLSPGESIPLDKLMTYHCDTIKKAPLSNLDPSLLLGFYFHSFQDFQQFRDGSALIAKEYDAIYSIHENEPKYDMADDDLLDDIIEDF